MSKNIKILTKETEQYLKDKSDDPYLLYLSSLASSGRRSMESQLSGIVKMIGFEGKPTAFPWSKLRYPHLVKIKYDLVNAGKSANTVNTSLAAVKGVLRTAFNLGKITAEDYLRIQSINRVNSKHLPVGRSLSANEIKKLFSVCRKNSEVMNIRDKAIIALMLSTGVRRAEIVAINCSDYDTRKSIVVIKHGKGGRERVLVITAGTKRRLTQWLKVRGNGGGALFTRVVANMPTQHRLSSQAIYNIVRTKSKQAGIKCCTPHDLRRTLVTRLLGSGVDLNTVRKIVGHADINTTARYDRRSEDSNKRIIQKVMTF